MSVHQTEQALKRLAKRKAKETRFRYAGMAAVVIAMLMLGWLIVSLVGTGYTAFFQHHLAMNVVLSENNLDPEGARDPDHLRKANYRKVIQESLYARFPKVTDRRDKRALFKIVSASGSTNHIRQMVYQNPDVVGREITIVVPTSDNVDQLLKGYIDRNAPEEFRKVSDQQIEWIDQLVASGELKSIFNWRFFTATDSRDPELAGIAGG